MTADDRTERGNARLLADIAATETPDSWAPPQSLAAALLPPLIREATANPSQVAAFTAALHTLTDQQLGALAEMIYREQTSREPS